MSLKPERMLVRCYQHDCDSGLIDIGIFDDLEKMKFKPFALICEEGHKNEYKAHNIMRESDWPERRHRCPRRA